MIALVKKFLEKKIQFFIGKGNIKQVESFLPPQNTEMSTTKKKKRSTSSKKSS